MTTVTDAPTRIDTAWSKGIEQILDAGPTRDGWWTEGEEDLDRYLERLLEDAADCGTSAWREVVGHTGAPGSYSTRSRTDRCHVRGHPACSRDLAERQLRKHEERLNNAYGDGAVVISLFGDSLDDIEMLGSEVGRWERRRPVRRALQGMVGVFGVDPATGRFELRLLVPRGCIARIRDLWTSEPGNHLEPFEVVADPVVALVDLKVWSETGLFSAVEAGTIDPTVARAVLAAERGKRRTKFMGGFLGLGRSNETASEVDDRPVAGEAAAGAPAEESFPDPRTVRDRLRSYVSHLSGGHLQTKLRGLLGTAELLGDRGLVSEITAAIRDIPDDSFTCRQHRHCDVIETGLRLRSRQIRGAIRRGAATGDTADSATWTDQSWPDWRRSAQPLLRIE